MQLVFESYEPLPDADLKRTRIHITTPDPDADQQGRSDAYVELSDAQITGAASSAALWTLIRNELGRVYRRNAVKAKLDPMVGTTDTV
jgi:hypothetical protein